MNLKDPVEQPFEEPHCDTELPFSMYAYDHLKGVAIRSSLSNSSEQGLINILSNMVPSCDTVEEFGHRVKMALEKVSLIHL